MILLVILGSTEKGSMHRRARIPHLPSKYEHIEREPQSFNSENAVQLSPNPGHI